MTTARPFLMFQDDHAQDALDLYFNTSPESHLVQAERYAEGEPGPVGTIKVGVFALCSRGFMCSDSPVKHDFSLTPVSSTFIDFDSVEELERITTMASANSSAGSMIASVSRGS